MSDNSWSEHFEEWYEFLDQKLFGPSPAEVIKRTLNDVSSHIRRLDRVQKKAVLEETNFLNALRKAFPNGRHSDLIPLAVQLERHRESMLRTAELKSDLQAMHSELQSTEVNTTMAQVITNVAQALSAVNQITGGGAGASSALQQYKIQRQHFASTKQAIGRLHNISEDDTSGAHEILKQLAEEEAIRFEMSLPSAGRSNVAQSFASEIMSKTSGGAINDGDMLSRLDMMRKKSGK